ncbi:hypothetical protein [Alkalibacterium sp. 20]|uniref:hypothetical protein n=1 Tax=Alkalibacterium sp. 20 TaxID=1798803 RepID=UPI000AEFA5B9|nr:hypothetical protein [Alkalibacterium sp. 20]
MQIFINVLLGLSIFVGYGLMIAGQIWGLIFILITLFGSLYIQYKRSKEKTGN